MPKKLKEFEPLDTLNTCNEVNGIIKDHINKKYSIDEWIKEESEQLVRDLRKRFMEDDK